MTDEDSTPTLIVGAANPAHGKQFTIGNIPHVIVPKDCDITNMEDALTAPARIRAKVLVRDLESFLSYLADYVQTNSAIFAEWLPEGLVAVAIIDYPPDASTPAWGEHRCSLRTQHSAEWLRWMKTNKQGFSQVGFAEFVEDNAPDFVRPSGADMLSIAREIEVKSNVQWKSAVRLDNGDVTLQYVSETKAGAGSVEVPTLFQIAIAPFRNGPRYAVDVRLRHKLDEGVLSLRYELLQTERVLDLAVKEVLAEIEKSTSLTPLTGPAPELC